MIGQADTMTTKMVILQDGMAHIPEDCEKLFKRCPYFKPHSLVFANFSESKMFSLLDFTTTSMNLLLSLIYEDGFLTLSHPDTSYLNFFRLCSYLLVSETFLLSSFYPSRKFILCPEKALILSYSLKEFGYLHLCKYLLHFMHLPSDLLKCNTLHAFYHAALPLYHQNYGKFSKNPSLCRCKSCNYAQFLKNLRLFEGIY